jgi:hypothetical protein
VNEELHKAIIAALTAALAPVQVYSQAVENAARPFLLVGDAQGDAWDTSDSDGAKLSLEVAIESDYHGSKEALELADQVKATLAHGAGLNLNGTATLVDLWTSPPSTDTLDDGRITRAVVRVSCLLDDID